MPSTSEGVGPDVAARRLKLVNAIDRMQERLDAAFDLTERFEIEAHSAAEVHTAGEARLREHLGDALGLGATDLGIRALLAVKAHRSQAEHAARWLHAQRNFDRAQYLVVRRRRALRELQTALRDLTS